MNDELLKLLARVLVDVVRPTPHDLVSDDPVDVATRLVTAFRVELRNLRTYNREVATRVSPDVDALLREITSELNARAGR